MSMFGNVKPAASLSSALLARKGQAKPAMRPQGFGGFGMPSGGLDDLGWNDMGDNGPYQPQQAPVPPVLVQREVLREEFAATQPVMAEPAPAPRPAPAKKPAATAKRSVSVATAARIGRETKALKTKAAFTLRLDHDRHLRLRLASAIENASAQQLVTAALDQFLQSLPEVEQLVSQLPARARR